MCVYFDHWKISHCTLTSDYYKLFLILYANIPLLDLNWIRVSEIGGLHTFKHAHLTVITIRYLICMVKYARESGVDVWAWAKSDKWKNAVQNYSSFHENITVLWFLHIRRCPNEEHPHSIWSHESIPRFILLAEIANKFVWV